MGKKNSRGAVKVRSNTSTERRLVRRLDVQLETFRRVCTCVAWQPHEPGCPQAAIEEAQAKSSRAETCLDSKGGAVVKAEPSLPTEPTVVVEETKKVYGVVDCKFTYAPDRNIIPKLALRTRVQTFPFSLSCFSLPSGRSGWTSGSSCMDSHLILCGHLVDPGGP
jgi:hypothetical protein